MATWNWQISCSKFTAGICIVGRNKIADAAPILSKFKGGTVTSLINWATKFGPVEMRPLTKLEKKGFGLV